MATFEEIIDGIDDMLDDAWGLPMTGKCMLNGDLLREKIEQLRLNFPTEIKRARSVLDERERIITKANSDAEQTIMIAKKRASEILDEQVILTEAKTQANEIMRTANEEAAKMRRAAVEFVNNILVRTEEHYDNALNLVKQAKRSIESTENKAKANE